MPRRPRSTKRPLDDPQGGDSPRLDTNLTRRQFAAYFAGTGLGTTLLPGVVGAELQEAGSAEITSDMLVDELDRNEWFYPRTVVYAPPFRESELRAVAIAYQDTTIHHLNQPD